VLVRFKLLPSALGASAPASFRRSRRGSRLYNLHELDLDPAAAGFRVVVSGHSHKPTRIERGGVFYVNPGSAGPRRFRLPVTVARLDLAQSPWRVDFIDFMA
jgi:predicted phosphodiesterase